MDVAFDQEQFDFAESWCCLALHSLFENAGESNRAKISRYAKGFGQSD